MQPAGPSDAAARGAATGANTSTVKAKGTAQERRRRAAQESARARRQYETLSLLWCEKLFVPVDAATLRQAAHYITPEDYDGIIVERVADNLCGYPLCSRKTRAIDRQFHISLSRRKVFDVSEHGNYCGDRCMVGSRFYRYQLPEDPVYMRKRGADLDIDVLPLDYDGTTAVATEKGGVWDGKVKQEEKEEQQQQQQQNTDQNTLEWYRRSLVRKMNIPESVAASSPLRIVEHVPGEAAFDASSVGEAIGRLSFADVEGFKPEKDKQRIKQAVRAVNTTAAAREASNVVAGGSTSEKGGQQAGDDDGVLRVTVKGMPPEAQKMMDAQWLSGCDDDDESDGDTIPASDSGHFAKLFPGENSRHGYLSMSLFGRMWTLVDILATKSTAAFLRDLAQAGAADQLRTRAADYYVAPSDESMATRQGLFASGMARELDELRHRLRITAAPGVELRMLVSTLELRSNMVIFNKGERQLLCVVLLLALARVLEGLGRELDSPTTAQELDTMLGSLGSDRALLGAVAARFHQPY
ncbi:hypothetical protein LPJ61_001661 [Coemansia biformis]|uniref:RNA polymerase II subunit B1 CTD phosphatase RPAP2 homolog n=1 Tax=Coemansia biformis TaxID=1286918 RepID=A0A9W8D0E0_9FUNG|nr:hypothetical protein LPJ61_001661 [Coemansia biformis]